MSCRWPTLNFCSLRTFRIISLFPAFKRFFQDVLDTQGVFGKVSCFSYEKFCPIISLTSLLFSVLISWNSYFDTLNLLNWTSNIFIWETYLFLLFNPMNFLLLLPGLSVFSLSIWLFCLFGFRLFCHRLLVMS